MKPPEPQPGAFFCPGEPLVPPGAPSFRYGGEAHALTMPAAERFGRRFLSLCASRRAKPGFGGQAQRAKDVLNALETTTTESRSSRLDARL
jgi:hypothetical protein